MHKILSTSTGEHDFPPEPGLAQLIGDPRIAMDILDFGCGLGRNALALAQASPWWNIAAYDLPGMAARASDFIQDKPGAEQITVMDNLDMVYDSRPYDVVFACYCFQHIHPGELRPILSLLKECALRLLVIGRDWMDDTKANPFQFIEHEGWHLIGERQYDERKDHRLAWYESTKPKPP